MKETNSQVNALRQNPEFRRFYFWACIGFSLIGLTYLSRETLSRMNEGLAVILGIMPSLAGSFATPYILFLGIAMEKKEHFLLKNSKVFVLINLFVLGMCMLIEYLHLWLNLGACHRNDLAASRTGMLMALLSFHLVRGKELTNSHLVSEQ